MYCRRLDIPPTLWLCSFVLEKLFRLLPTARVRRSTPWWKIPLRLQEALTFLILLQLVRLAEFKDRPQK